MRIIILFLMVSVSGYAQITQKALIIHREYPYSDTVKVKMLITMECNPCMATTSWTTGLLITRYNYDPTFTENPKIPPVEQWYLQRNKTEFPSWVVVWMVKKD